MANSRYTVACPTCDAPVPIKNESLAGKKVECPTCKARFVVPPPPAAEAPLTTVPVEPAKKSKKEKKPKVVAMPGDKKPPNTKMLIGAGVAAVLALFGVAAYFVLTGEDEKKSPPIATRPQQQFTQTTDRGSEPGDTTTTDPAEVVPDPSTPEKPPEIVKPKRPPSPIREVTNLLPGDSKAVYRVNHDTLSLQATPLFNAIFDTKVRDLFRQSLTFGSDRLSTSMHCVVGPDRKPFVLLRGRDEFDTDAMIQELKLGNEPKTAKGGSYYAIDANPLVEAISGAFSKRALALAAGIDLPVPPPSKQKTQYALSILDPRTIAIGEISTVEKYLNTLEPNGFPVYKSTPAVQAATQPAAPADGSEPAPEQPKPVEPPAPIDANRVTTTVLTYLTIDPALKRILNLLDDEAKTPPCVVYAEDLDQTLATPLADSALQALPEAARPLAKPLATSLSKVKRLGATLDQFARDHLRAQLLFEYTTEDDAKNAADDAVVPVFVKYLRSWDYLMSTQTRIVGNAAGLAANIPAAGYGGVLGSGGISGGIGGEGGFRGGLSGRPGSGIGGSGNFGSGSSSDEGSSGGLGFAGGSGGISAPGGGSSGQFGFGGTPGAGFAPTSDVDLLEPKGPNEGIIELARSDRDLTLKFALNWPDKEYNSEIQPEISRAGGQFRGRLGVFGGDFDYHTAAAVAPQVVAAQKQFPRGTLERQTARGRYGIAYPPERRASFFVELLPYLGQSQLKSQIDDKTHAWYDKENLAAAESWVPELLVPYYPQESWRATNPLAPGRSLGGTNYVGVAGVGLDAARYDPSSPGSAKKVGITGYDWSSKPEEITDGLSNTAYLVQVAPGGGRPWIAGGGATLMGVAEDDTAMTPFSHQTPGGTNGTYALMADGSVRFVKAGTDPKVFRAMATRAGGETLGKEAELVKPRKGKAELKTTASR